MQRLTFIAVALILPAAAFGTYYLNEGFEGSQFPPPGWKKKQTGSGIIWYRNGGGPWGYYADGGGEPPVGTEGSATLESPPINWEKGKTLYYHFKWRFGIGGSMGGNAGFYLTYADTQHQLVSWRVRFNWPDWDTLYASVVVTRTAPIIAKWQVDAWSVGMVTSIDFNVDGVKITDESMAAVEPSSLGKVKALFR